MQISIFEYMDVGHFLSNYYKERKKINSSFSYTVWSNQLNFTNKTLLRLIVTGRRRISEKSRKKFNDFFKFSPVERDYFDALVEYSQSKTFQQKQNHGARLVQLQRKQFNQTDVPLNSEIFNDPYSSIVLMAISSTDSPLTFTELSKFFSNLESDRIQSIIASLIKDRLICVENGFLSALQPSFKVKDEFSNQGLKNYYEYWITKSKNAIGLPFKIRRFSSMQLALSETEFEEAIIAYQEFMTTVLSRAAYNKLPERRIYLMNMALFPVTDIFQMT